MYSFLVCIANLVLQDTIERIHVGVGQAHDRQGNSTGQYADIWRGVYLIRGENVVLLGEVVRYHLSFTFYILT